MQRLEARSDAPFGLSFAIEELQAARRWAERHRLTLTVALDHVIDGAEFEEMLLFQTRDRRRRVFTMWRTAAGVTGQKPGCFSIAYASLGEALRATGSVEIRRRFWFGARRMAYD